MKHTHTSKTEFVTSFLDVNMSDFDLYILKKYLFIPLLVLCIPILWRPALQCVGLMGGFIGWPGEIHLGLSACKSHKLCPKMYCSLSEEKISVTYLC
jgi:hypothetical protein